jgi:tight adherence protein B
MRRFLSAFLTLVLAAGAVAPFAAASELAVQSVNTSEFPKVGMTVTLPSSTNGARPTAAKVWENGVETAASIENLTKDREPLDVVLVVDVSGSMKGVPLESAQRAAANFISKRSASDRVAVVAFGSSPRVVTGFTGDTATLGAAIRSLKASGETALYDGVTRSLDLFSGEPTRRRALVLLSDGRDTVSSTNLDVAVKRARQLSVPVFAVALKSPEYDPAALKTLARASGGRLTSAPSAASLVSIYGQLAEELQKSYLVSYVSRKPNTPDLDLRLALEGAGVPLTKSLFIANPTFNASALPAIPITPLTLTELIQQAATQSAIVLLAALSLGLLGFAIISSIVRERRPIDELAYYDQLQSVALAGGMDANTLDPSRNRILDLVGNVAERRGFIGLAQTKLERAGLPLRPTEYITFHVLAVLIAGLGTMVLSHKALLTLGVVVLTTTAPILWLNHLETRRRHAFEEQLPDILTLMAGSLRAGWGLQQSVDLVVQQAGEPASNEFRRVQAEVRLGLSLDQALRRLADRIGSADFAWVASAIAIQREVGGNLSEVLDTLAATMRERAELYRQVSALTAEGRLSAIILVLLPFLLAGALYFINPRYIAVLTGTIVGAVVLGFGLILLLVGVVWLQRVVKIDV